MNTNGPLFFVVGNGPSLKTKILDALPDGRWIGMNSAYKYWDETGKYPRYYSCLDPVVVVQHADAILRLIDGQAIEEFFLHEAIVEARPQLKGHPKITLRDAFLKQSDAVPFSPLSYYKQTTGALATRFCIERGHKNICLLGIDCNYVEKLSEARSGKGYELVIKDDIHSNPNYFFDNYQEKSEKFQVPNPHVHSGNLHLQSFVALRNDIVSSGATVRISVGSRESLLSKFGLFPILNVEEHLGARRLEAIAVPLTPNELDEFLERLEYWIDPKLQPSFNIVSGLALHIFMSCREESRIRGKIEAALERLPWLSNYFAQVRVTFLDLSPEVDYYVKGESLNVFCNKSGPNIFWLAIMKACQDYRFTFLMEADCVPVRPGWIDALEQATKDCTPATWVIGANYFGPTKILENSVLHVNGNAVYATDNRHFQKYIEGDFLRALRWITEEISNSVAYDVSFALGVSNYKEMIAQIGIDPRKYAVKYSFTPVICNISAQRETEDSESVDVIGDILSDPSVFICHGQPALRALASDFQAFESFYAANEDSPREFNIDRVHSLTKAISVKSKGFGRVEVCRQSNFNADAKKRIRIGVGASCNMVRDGSMELRFATPKGFALAEFTVIGNEAERGKVNSSTVCNTIDGETCLRLGRQICNGSVKEISVELAFDIASNELTDELAIIGLRLLHFPRPARSPTLETIPKSETVRRLEDGWVEWVRAGQKQVDEKYGFIECDQLRAMPRLKEISPKTVKVFGSGGASVVMDGNATARFRFGCQPNEDSDPDVHVLVRVRVERDCEFTLGGKAFGYPVVEEKRRLAAGLSAEISLQFRLLFSEGSDFFLSFEVNPISMNGQRNALVIEQVRFQKTPQFVREDRPEPVPRIISVNPDAESFFGHFLNYEARLGRAVTALGMEHVIAGPVDGEPAIYAAHPELARVFTVRTNTLYAKKPGQSIPKLSDFEAELDRYLRGIDQSKPSLLFMYCGSLEIAEVFSRLADKYPYCTFAISLYYLSWLDMTSSKLHAYWKPRLMAIAQNPRIRLIVPSSELAEELRTHLGVSPEIMPHPSTSFDDEELRTLKAGTLGEHGEDVTVVFPGNQRGGKGYELTRDAIKTLLSKNVKGLRLRVRCPPADSLNKERREFYDSVRNEVEILDSYLDEDAFRALLLSADVVALPYTADRFANRTSGLLIDSLLLGIPCVVIENTWLETTVHQYDFGIATKPDGKAIAQGILEAVDRNRALKEAALAGRERYMEKSSWNKLVGFLSPALTSQWPEATVHEEIEPVGQKQRLLIIGNGPSARLLADAGFENIPSDMDTWGTTAAYRYFERVGWWPTYYALADRKVVFHHRANFARLLDDPKVTTRKFFLSWKVSDSPKMELIPHSSTGSFSLKKALELGYKEIYLIGMEGAYVEEILESRRLSPEEISERGFGILNLSPAESKLLIIERTPTFNPNYFFSGYQQAGDVYSLPQAHTHQANWEASNVAAGKAGARVINLSRISRIDAFERGEIRDVFPYLAEDCWNDIIDPFTEKARHAKSVYELSSGPDFSPQTDTVWRYRKDDQQDGVLRAIFRHIGHTKGRSLVAGARITANSDINVNVTFGRDGQTEYEGTGQIETLKAGKPRTFVLSAKFHRSHERLKFQISRLDLGGASDVDLTVENIWLTESVDSVVSRHGANELTARQAETAFSMGNDSFALAIWLWLLHSGENENIDEEVVRVAKRIGMSSDLINPDQLLNLLSLVPLFPVEPGSMQPISSLPAAKIVSKDFLERLGGEMLDSPGDGAKAALLLRTCAAKILLDPHATLPRLSEGARLSKGVAAAQKTLPNPAPLNKHFARVLAFAKRNASAPIT